MDKEEMTLEEVIETLQVWISTADDEYDREEMGRVCGLKEALHEIKKIKPCEDAISRSDAIRVASGFCHWSNIPKELAKLPSVNPIPCEDAISRQAALEGLASIAKAKAKSDAQKSLMGRVMFFTEQLPSVSTEKTGRWVPVSERLPEINQRVLVTSYGRVCYAMMTSADGNSGYPIFRLQDSLKERVVCETTVHSEWTTSRITAWMPLPQPYKGESEE